MPDIREIATFDYGVPAELFMGKRKGRSRQRLSYRCFATAAAAPNARTVGQHTDGRGIIAEVQKVCAARASMTLAGATFTAYSEMASK